MPWGVVAGAVIGAAADTYSSDKAADAQRDASKDATKLGLYQYEQGLKEVAPFKELGLSAIPGLERMAGSNVVPFKFRDSDKFLDRYFGSEEFSVLNNQASDQILRNRSATGGLRSGGANVDLAKIAPTLGLQALDRINAQDLERYGINQSAQADKYNQLYGLASMGANVASGNQVAGANFASSAGANALSAGNARAAAYLNQGQAARGLASDLTTAYLSGQGAGGGGGGVSNQYTGSNFDSWVASQRGRV